MRQGDDVPFSTDELATLREHGIVLFANRVIYRAQPPMSDERLAAIQTLCAGPIPEALAALWRQTAGGRLDYDLALSMNGKAVAFGWVELFWDGSDGYHDLQGWVEHEMRLNEEVAHDEGRVWTNRLTHLPFGGFEYLDRIYAVVEPGPEHGSIVAWMQGLPPAWTDALHEDSVSTVAPDLGRAFAALHLDEDPLAPTNEHSAGQSLLEYLDDRHRAHGLDRDLLTDLVAFYRRAMIDQTSPGRDL